MQKTRKGLGRGLSALIPDADMDFLTRVARDQAADTKSPSVPRKKKTTSTRGQSARNTVGKTPSPTKSDERQIDDSAKSPSSSAQSGLTSLAELVPLSQIEANPFQPRRTFSNDEMQELTASIKEHGVLQPVLLRPIPPSGTQVQNSNGPIHYQLIAGERRWRASQIAELTTIPAIIRRVTDQQALELAVIENVQRHDISALDAALAYRRLAQEFSLSQDEIALRVGKSRVSISNTIRLLDLPAEVQKAIVDGSLTEGHGRAILLAGSDGARRAVFRRVLRESLSVRATEELARVLQQEPHSDTGDGIADSPASDSKSRSHSLPEIRRIEEGLQKHLGTRVRLRPRKRGGQVVIQYFSNEELERLLKVMLRS